MVRLMTEAHPTSYPQDVCPLCGGSNQCAIATNDGDQQACAKCWCKDLTISEDVLNKLPESARGQACICATCAGATPQLAPNAKDLGGRDAWLLEWKQNRVVVSPTGGQILSWHPAFDDVLWTASAPEYDAGKPVRGGVPVVFPWFGDHKSNPSLPAHGFARSQIWRCVDLQPTQLTLQLEDSKATRAIWNHAFLAKLTISVGETLRIAMSVTNRGPTPFTFEQALHTYFASGDIADATIHGLEQVPFTEHAKDPQGSWDPNSPLQFRAETDRVFQDVPAQIRLHAATLNRNVILATENAHSAIVWNPWPKKTARLSQMQADDWKSFCCIESANVAEHSVHLEPGATHQMSLELKVESAS
jgi:glucose-6-phosphate 1-epimerase